jgi:hypothetical protein
MIFLHGYNDIVAKKKIRERTMLNVICWGVTAGLAVGLAELIGMLTTPYTVASHLMGMYLVGPMLPASSELLQSWTAVFGTEEALLWTPLCLLVAGLVVGYIAPTRITLAGRSFLAAKLGFSVAFVCFAFVWLADLISFQFRPPAYLFSAQYIEGQLICFLIWPVVAGVGGLLGGFALSRRKGGAKSSDKAQKLSKSATTP